MKAAVHYKYGPPSVLLIEERDVPSPEEDEVQIQIHYCTVNRTDSAAIQAIPFLGRMITGLFKPKFAIPGGEFSGVISAVGENVRGYQVGQRVFGFKDIGGATQAEYTCIHPRFLTSIPEGINCRQAVACSEGAHYAYSGIKKIRLRAGQNALVYGASGAIGSAAVQLLKAMDLHVTAVVSTRHVDLMRQLGADKVVDYTKEDFTQDEIQYDFVFDAVGRTSFFKCFRLIKRGGKFIASDLGDHRENIWLPAVTSIIKPFIGFRETLFPFPSDVADTLKVIVDLMIQGKFSALIDREYALDDIVAAYEYVGSHRKTGNVIVRTSYADNS